MTAVHVPGKKSGHILLFALSTCGWCQKTKRLLDDLGVEYYYEYVDHLNGDERERTLRDMTDWNPSGTFPTLVINNERCIVGYREREIREALSIA